ncbi:MAG: hypothetical protein JNL19_12290 [Burkholderiales bacterium]|nr:hypothetical protein [Burkholderiales bacterium]
MKTVISIAVLSITLITGCATEFQQGRNFDMNRASTFQRGKTTRQEIVAALGEPTSSGRNSDASYIEYQHETVKVDAIAQATSLFRSTNSMGDSRLKVCRFWFDSRNVLKEYNCADGLPNYQSLGK